jgi:drug/metabolite transporter (DMT)-like permease
MGIVSPLVSLGVLVPIAVGLIQGERPGSIEYLGIGLALAGILLASGPELTGAESAQPLLLATVAALAFGGMFVLMAEGSVHSPLMTMTGMRITTVLLMALVLLRVRSLGGAQRTDVPVLVGIGVLDVAANVTYGFASTLGMLSTVSVLGNLYPVVTAVLAAVVLRERLRPIQYIGVVVAIVGVLTLSAAM